MASARQIGDDAISAHVAKSAAERAILLAPAFAATTEASRRVAYVRIIEALLPAGETLKELGSDLEDYGFTLTSLQSTTAILLQCLDIDRAKGKSDRSTCTNTCEYTWDGVTYNRVGNGKCEDGGDQWWQDATVHNGVVSDNCPRGSDCDDCGWAGDIGITWRATPFWGGDLTGGAASILAKPNAPPLVACP